MCWEIPGVHLEQRGSHSEPQVSQIQTRDDDIFSAHRVRLL